MASIWKQQRPCNVDTDIDRISNLPETLISQILSLLPTKFAVRTCVLSKAWKLHWTKIASFDFDERLWPETERTSLPSQDEGFLKFVNMVFTNHSGESIDKFRFRWNYTCAGASSLRKWIDAALAQNVRILDLDIKPGLHKSVFPLPDALYICGTLEVLKLRGYFSVKLAHEVHLPKLTVLLLQGVEFESDECVCKLVSGCPLLQSLMIKEGDVFSSRMRTCTLSSPTLKHLQIFVNNYGVSGCLRMEREIDAPALECLSVNDCFSGKVSIQGLTSGNVLNVDLSCACPSGPNEHETPDSRLQRSFDCDSFPKLYAATMTILGKATKNRLSAGFEEVTKLVVRLNHPQWSSLVDLVDRCTNLEVLYISRGEEESKGTRWKDLDHVPECLSSLKKVTFQTFYGTRDEMKMLKLILDHGLVMQRVELCSNARDPDEFDRRSALLKEQSMLPKVSPTCEITSKVYFQPGRITSLALSSSSPS